MQRPFRAIPSWVPVFLYILNDIINGQFVTLPYIMNLHGWIGGLLLLWSMGALNYYCCHLLYRMQRVFPGAVTMGDMSFYITRSGLAMLSETHEAHTPMAACRETFNANASDGGFGRYVSR